MRKGLLLGAGFSFDIGMPLTTELTHVFLGAFNRTNASMLSLALSKNSPFGKDRPIDSTAISEGFNLLLNYKNKKGTNYEAFLTEIQENANKPSVSQPVRDSYHYLFSVFYEIIHTILSMFQKQAYDIMYNKNKVWFEKINDILSDKESWVFTLNHDLFFEYLALDFGIPITYGDDKSILFPINNLQMDRKIRFTYSERTEIRSNKPDFFRDIKGVNLIKLHGGLSELEYTDGHLLCNLSLDKKSAGELAQEFKLAEEMAYFHNNKKVPSGKDKVITNPDGNLDIVSKSMLTGGHKYSDTNKIKKGEEKLKVFDDVLKELDELTIIGYGFGDTHVNFRLSNALLLNGNLSIQIINPTSIQTPECIKQFDYDFKIKKAMCGAAQWIEYCKNHKWNPDQIKCLKENEIFRAEIRQNVQNQLLKYLRF